MHHGDTSLLFYDRNTLYFLVMGRPSNRRRARRVEIRRVLQRIVSEPISINCAVWNCNGLIRDNKQDMIVEDNNIHVLSISETHLRQGSNGTPRRDLEKKRKVGEY